MRRAALLLLGAPAADAHASLTIPLGRNGGHPDDPGNYDTSMYYTGHTGIPGDSILPDKVKTNCNSHYSTAGAPWHSPGTAPVVGRGCGLHCPGDDCNKHYKKDPVDMPAKEKLQWTAGAAEEVAFGFNTNHGGGYSYRLCKADGDISEKCFQKGALDFVGTTSWMQHKSDKSNRKAIKATRTNFAKDGSMWTMNPFPDCHYDDDKGAGDNCKARCRDDPCDKCRFRDDGPVPGWLNFVDLVRIPASASGHYLLSLRWDVEDTSEVWQNCGDVVISGGGPAPPAPPSPSGSRYHCSSGTCVAADSGHSTMAKCRESCDGPTPPSPPAPRPPAPSGECGSVCKGDSTDDNCYHPSWSGSGVNKCSHESSQDACESDDGGQWCGDSVRLVNRTA